ncbi:MAG: hypothetical protein JSV88_04105 [Candidatus Aminicenantes bacterium]|nr:MAG: hypothetical protein JSV88_04105 [Candidatus Aminicenantes bacterium]
MKRRFIALMVTLFILIFTGWYSYSEEIPKPTYDNSIIFSWTYGFLNADAAETAYIKNQYGNGMYALLCFTVFEGVDMDWYLNIVDAGSGIQAFKDKLDEMIAFAKTNKVGIHLIITYGISRNLKLYNTAREEDVRNCQWYNDNNISSLAQMSGVSAADAAEGQGGFPFLDLDHVKKEQVSKTRASSSAINNYVFATTSRYARKLRAHLEAKVTEAFDYLQQEQASNPDVLIIVSAPGESELNYHRLNASKPLQDYFCDYSPFAVMEFGDWIKHEGLYAEGEKYAGQGYANGGSRYQGTSGLSNFNADFGTSFTTWNLKYYNWNLSDPVDTDYTDGTNPDTNIIPVSQYTYGGMMPTSGSNYISGGFDPPRVMKEPGTNDFYDLWHTFRETLVANYVKDMSGIARDSGFPKAQYFTHQIPADYLFGTRPNDPLIPDLNARYYSSGSPLWTADAYEDIGLGVTLYDINYGTWFARTTLYGIGAADALSDNWAAMEYNPEVIPENVSATLSSVQTLYNQMVRLYNGDPHVVSFFVWQGTNHHIYDYKGNNRETAAKQFFDAIKDTARQPIGTVFTPKKVENFTGSYSATTGLVNLSWSSKIWSNLTYTWADWGDFKEFVIYRGYTEDFTTDNSSEIVRKTTYTHVDYGFDYGGTVYYKMAAVNSKGQIGPIEMVSVEVPEFVPTPILSVSRDRLNFAYIAGLDAPPTQAFRITNTGTGSLNWTAANDAEWLNCDPGSGIGDAVVTVSVDPTGLLVGTYNAVITVSDPNAISSPHTITVYLTVKNSSQNKLPFGSFDTPLDGSTVRSSVAVTGWVLDDVGVDSVKIYRDPLTGEGNALIYIGAANFVEGARPDIEAAYPDYPKNYQAGWGYMMLTNFLPNGGNGTFKIYAIAVDSFGYEVTLGTKTITCDNANAVKPFGAIDTPTQGGEASGDKFINWGWVLTPMPNSIPTDGSTINVYVDGVNLGHPTYNINRSDIAALFPGYANSNGAAGYFMLDTTQYRDGIHTIQWTAADFAGNTDGIGSRYFTVQNAGTGNGSTSTSTQRKTAVRFIGELSGIPFDRFNPIRVKTGYHQYTTPQTLSPDRKGIITVETRELAPIEIHFPGKTWYASPLPVGSTLNSSEGIFYWQPGPAFLGNYTFEFLVKQGIPGKLERKTVKIEILPKFKRYAIEK